VIVSTSAVNYNAIDPNLIVDAQSQWWLVFGSFWTGIKLIRLDPATGLRSTSDTTVRPLAQRFTASGAVEAPFVFRHGDLEFAAAFRSRWQAAARRVRGPGYTRRDELWTKSARGEGRGRRAEGAQRQRCDGVVAGLA
jgi:hypothetical protein